MTRERKIQGYPNCRKFCDISKPDLFFLRLQAETGVNLKERKSAIIFDEIQLQPKVRQAIKYLVQDGRYESINQFAKKYSKKVYRRILFSQKDVDHIGTLQLKPLYMLPFALEEM